MDESVLDADQVENLIKFCPTKEEMDLLKVKFTGLKILSLLTLIFSFYSAPLLLSISSLSVYISESIICSYF